MSWVSPRLVVYEVCEVGNPLKKGIKITHKIEMEYMGKEKKGVTLKKMTSHYKGQLQI